MHGLTDFIPLNDGDTLSIGKGRYTNFEGEWFLLVGSGLALTVSLLTISASIFPLLLAMGLGPGIRWFWRATKHSQTSMNDLYTNAEWSLALRMASSTNVVFLRSEL